MDIYRNISYQVVEISSLTHEGIAVFEQALFKQALIGRISICVSQSGVSKSSILHTLLPTLKNKFRCNNISDISGLGK